MKIKLLNHWKLVITSVFMVSALHLNAQTEPELMYYKFNGAGTTVPNTATSPVGTNPAPLVAHTQGGVGQFGGALLGGGTTGYLNTGWNSSLSGDWTLSFWIDLGTAATTFQYFFGDNGAGTWRMFANGAAGVGNVVMAKTGFTNTVAYGVADGNPHVVHYVWETSAGNLKAYVDGVLSNTVTQTSGVVTGGTGLRIGGYTSGALVAGTKMDEVRLYNRALSAQEIADTWNKELPLNKGPNDAGISQIVEPVDTCTGTYDVKVEVANYGTNKINNVQINWSINSIIQTPVAYTSVLDTVNGLGASKAIVTLGTVTLAVSNFTDIEAWTSLPNNVVDTATKNDAADVSVFGFPFPTLNIGPNTTICPNDPITLDAGSGRDDILWSNTSTNQTISVGSAGTYFVEVSENGCWSYDTIVISLFPQPPAVDLGPDTTLCFGKTIVLDATAAGVTYLWQDNSTNPTFTVNTAGVYSVELEDGNGCKSTDGINITYYLEPQVTIYVAPSDDLCFGVPQTFTAFPLTQGSIDYQWKINGVNSGAQTTSAIFNGPADDGDSVSVDLITDICATSPYPVPSNKIGMTVNPKPKNLTGKLLVKENTTETYVVPLSTGSAYVWRVTGGTISGDSTKNIVTIDWGVANPNAILTCEETDTKNCVRLNQFAVNVVSIVGINNIAEGFGMGDAYPNPSNNLVNIPIHADQNRDITLQLFDMTGKMVKTLFHGTITGNKNIQVSVDDLNNGVYIYKLTTPNGYMSVKKLTVEH